MWLEIVAVVFLLLGLALAFIGKWRKWYDGKLWKVLGVIIVGTVAVGAIGRVTRIAIPGVMEMDVLVEEVRQMKGDVERSEGRIKESAILTARALRPVAAALKQQPAYARFRPSLEDAVRAADSVLGPR